MSPKHSDPGLELERMKLLFFSGQIREYARFKSDVSNHVMPSVKSNQNVVYILRSCLTEEPSTIVSNADRDINLVWKRLDERSGKPSKLAVAVIHEIKSLEQI